MEKINKDHNLSQSENIVETNIDKLKALFPEIVTEGKIDFKVLQEILGEEIEEGEEYYRFTWAGKANARREAQKPSTGTLRPAPEESVYWDTTQNLYIEGDNLEVLKLLQKGYAGKVKMIYIDPPYNTGKDFVYKDNYKDNLRNYQEVTGQIDDEGNKLSTNSDSDGRYHSNWLNMMYPRLRLTRNLLKDDGVIFMSIDDNEVENLRKIGNEIFGEDNFIGNIVLQTATDNNPTQINTEHEYILCFANKSSVLDNWFSESKAASLIIEEYDKLKLKYNNDIESIQKDLRKWIKKNEKNLPKVTHYDNVDKNGVFHDGDIANTRFGGYEYNVLHPITGKVCKVPDKGFRYPETTLKKMIDADNILFGRDESTLIKPKKRIEDVKDMLRTVIYEDGRSSTKIVDNLLARGVFDNPKSTTILARLMSFILQDGEIILDFFSGSASSTHSSFDLMINQENLNIKNIQIQLPEDLEKSLVTADAKTKKTIKKAISFLESIQKPPILSEIGKERIRRAAKKIAEENPEKAKNLDLGFKVFKLDTSNIKGWDGNPDTLDESLFDAQDNIKTDRTEYDVLYEILLKYGLDLTLPIEEKQISGKTVFSVGYGALFICLADNITNAVAKGIGEWKDELQPEVCRVVFKDSGFTDVEKTNSVQILKRFGITEIKSI